MGDKRVIINGKTLMNGTSVKGKRNVSSSSSSTTTFDGVITQGTSNVDYTLDISRVSYEGYTDYMELSKILDGMMETPAMVTVEEDFRPSGEKPFTLIRDYYDCVLSGDDYEIKPEDHTVENLSFTAARMKKRTKALRR